MKLLHEQIEDLIQAKAELVSAFAGLEKALGKVENAKETIYLICDNDTKNEARNAYYGISDKIGYVEDLAETIDGIIRENTDSLKRHENIQFPIK
jgi:hypothetical protein